MLPQFIIRIFSNPAGLSPQIFFFIIWIVQIFFLSNLFLVKENVANESTTESTELTEEKDNVTGIIWGII